MRKLIWKEWHEHSWKLGFGCVVLTALLVIGLHARLVSDASMVQGACWLAVIALPVLAGTGLVPAEREAGTLESLRSMPVSAGKILLAKTAMGALLCAGPIAFGAVVTAVYVGGRELYTGDLLSMFGRFAMTSLVLLAWMIALTIRLGSETRAALLAVGVLILWAMGSVGLAELLFVKSWPILERLPFACSPFAFLFHGPIERGPDFPEFWLVAAVQCVVLSGVGAATLLAFSRSQEEQP